MKNKSKKSSPVVLKGNASFVHRVLYLIKTCGKVETKIALSFGLIYGTICPITAYIIFHHALRTTGGLVKTSLVIVGLAGVLISLSNVSALMTELTKSEKLGWCYAILLEGTAMIMGGSPTSQVIGIIALMAVILANLLKTSYNALLKTE